MKAFSLSVIFLLLLCLSAKGSRFVSTSYADPGEDSTRFSFSLSYYNHAELIYKGAMTYQITNDYLGISRRGMFEKTGTGVYSTNIRKDVSDSIRLLKIDTLQRFYHNNCIMMTSGNEYFIALDQDYHEKYIHLHHYYHPQIERLIHFINTLVPEEYQIPYMTKDNKQDCK